MPGMQRYMEHFNRAINGKNGRYPPSAAAALPTCAAGASIKNELYAFETVCRCKHGLFEFRSSDCRQFKFHGIRSDVFMQYFASFFTYFDMAFSFDFLCFLISIFDFWHLSASTLSAATTISIFSASQILLQSRLLPHAAHAL